jgi:hypothetical protein
VVWREKQAPRHDPRQSPIPPIPLLRQPLLALLAFQREQLFQLAAALFGQGGALLLTATTMTLAVPAPAVDGTRSQRYTRISIDPQEHGHAGDTATH